jgi:hypothetical protein
VDDPEIKQLLHERLNEYALFLLGNSSGILDPPILARHDVSIKESVAFANKDMLEPRTPLNTGIRRRGFDGSRRRVVFPALPLQALVVFRFISESFSQPKKVRAVVGSVQSIPIN